MGLSTFIGGVHPYEGKELSADKPIQVIQPKGELVYPLSQHIGAPAKPLVAKGDKVLVGQKIKVFFEIFFLLICKTLLNMIILFYIPRSFVYYKFIVFIIYFYT